MTYLQPFGATRPVVPRTLRVALVRRVLFREARLDGPAGASEGVPGLALPGAHAVVAHSRDAADAAGDVVGQLGHKEDVGVAHDGDGPVA